MLVGTHAFLAYQNHFGVRWVGGDVTVDLDFAPPGKNISLALPSSIQADRPDAIESLKMGFLPVNEGTRYVKQDEQDFDLDFLTTRHRGRDAPVHVPQLKVTLQPLRFMEFSLQATMPLALPASTGPVVANVRARSGTGSPSCSSTQNGAEAIRPRPPRTLSRPPP